MRFRCEKAYTFIEMLAVFLMISLTVGIVYPVGWRLVQQYERRMERASEQQQEKQAAFLAFIRDEDNVQPRQETGSSP